MPTDTGSAPSVLVQPNAGGGTTTTVAGPGGTGTVTTVAGVAGGVLDAFKTSPVLLLVVLLNMAFVGVGGFFLLKLEEYRANDRKTLADLLTKCLTETVPVSYLDKHKE